MIDATHLKAHRTAASFLEKGSVSRYIGRTKGGLKSKLHAVCGGAGRPLILCLSEGQMSDHIGGKLTYPALPEHAICMIGDKGYDSDGSVINSVCRGAVKHYAAMALMKRSPKITTNWVSAMVHSRGGILHSFSDLFKTR